MGSCGSSATYSATRGTDVTVPSAPMHITDTVTFASTPIAVKDRMTIPSIPETVSHTAPPLPPSPSAVLTRSPSLPRFQSFYPSDPASPTEGHPNSPSVTPLHQPNKSVLLDIDKRINSPPVTPLHQPKKSVLLDIDKRISSNDGPKEPLPPSDPRSKSWVPRDPRKRSMSARCMQVGDVTPSDPRIHTSRLSEPRRTSLSSSNSPTDRQNDFLSPSDPRRKSFPTTDLQNDFLSPSDPRKKSFSSIDSRNTSLSPSDSRKKLFAPTDTRNESLSLNDHQEKSSLPTDSRNRSLSPSDPGKKFLPLGDQESILKPPSDPRKEGSLTTDPRKEASLPTNPRKEVTSPIDPRKVTSPPTDPRKEASLSTDPRKEALPPTDPRKETSPPTEPLKEASPPTEPRKEASPPTDPRKEVTSLIDPRKVASSPTDPRKVASSPTDPRKAALPPTDFRKEALPPTDPRKEVTPPIDPRKVASSPTDPRKVTSSPTDPRKEPSPPMNPRKALLVSDSQKASQPASCPQKAFLLVDDLTFLTPNRPQREGRIEHSSEASLANFPRMKHLQSSGPIKEALRSSYPQKKFLQTSGPQNETSSTSNSRKESLPPKDLRKEHSQSSDLRKKSSLVSDTQKESLPPKDLRKEHSQSSDLRKKSSLLSDSQKESLLLSDERGKSLPPTEACKTSMPRVTNQRKECSTPKDPQKESLPPKDSQKLSLPPTDPRKKESLTPKYSQGESSLPTDPRKKESMIPKMSQNESSLPTDNRKMFLTPKDSQREFPAPSDPRKKESLQQSDPRKKESLQQKDSQTESPAPTHPRKKEFFPKKSSQIESSSQTDPCNKESMPLKESQRESPVPTNPRQKPLTQRDPQSLCPIQPLSQRRGPVVDPPRSYCSLAPFAAPDSGTDSSIDDTSDGSCSAPIDDRQDARSCGKNFNSNHAEGASPKCSDGRTPSEGAGGRPVHDCSHYKHRRSTDSNHPVDGKHSKVTHVTDSDEQLDSHKGMKSIKIKISKSIPDISKIGSSKGCLQSHYSSVSVVSTPGSVVPKIKHLNALKHKRTADLSLELNKLSKHMKHDSIAAKHQPSTTSAKSQASKHDSIAAKHQPSTTSAKSQASKHDNIAAKHQPSTNSANSQASKHDSIAAKHQTSTTSAKNRASKHDSIAAKHQPSTTPTKSRAYKRMAEDEDHCPLVGAYKLSKVEDGVQKSTRLDNHSGSVTSGNTDNRCNTSDTMGNMSGTSPLPTAGIRCKSTLVPRDAVTASPASTTASRLSDNTNPRDSNTSHHTNDLIRTVSTAEDTSHEHSTMPHSTDDTNRAGNTVPHTKHSTILYTTADTSRTNVPHTVIDTSRKSITLPDPKNNTSHSCSVIPQSAYEANRTNSIMPLTITKTSHSSRVQRHPLNDTSHSSHNPSPSLHTHVVSEKYSLINLPLDVDSNKSHDGGSGTHDGYSEPNVTPASDLALSLSVELCGEERERVATPSSSISEGGAVPIIGESCPIIRPRDARSVVVGGRDDDVRGVITKQHLARKSSLEVCSTVKSYEEDSNIPGLVNTTITNSTSREGKKRGLVSAVAENTHNLPNGAPSTKGAPSRDHVKLLLTEHSRSDESHLISSGTAKAPLCYKLNETRSHFIQTTAKNYKNGNDEIISVSEVRKSSLDEAHSFDQQPTVTTAAPICAEENRCLPHDKVHSSANSCTDYVNLNEVLKVSDVTRHLAQTTTEPPFAFGNYHFSYSKEEEELRKSVQNSPNKSDAASLRGIAGPFQQPDLRRSGSDEAIPDHYSSCVNSFPASISASEISPAGAIVYSSRRNENIFNNFSSVLDLSTPRKEKEPREEQELLSNSTTSYGTDCENEHFSSQETQSISKLQPNVEAPRRISEGIPYSAARTVASTNHAASASHSDTGLQSPSDHSPTLLVQDCKTREDVTLTTSVAPGTHDADAVRPLHSVGNTDALPTATSTLSTNPASRDDLIKIRITHTPSSTTDFISSDGSSIHPKHTRAFHEAQYSKTDFSYVKRCHAPSTSITGLGAMDINETSENACNDEEKSFPPPSCKELISHSDASTDKVIDTGSEFAKVPLARSCSLDKRSLELSQPLNLTKTLSSHDDKYSKDLPFFARRTIPFDDLSKSERKKSRKCSSSSATVPSAVESSFSVRSRTLSLPITSYSYQRSFSLDDTRGVTNFQKSSVAGQQDTSVLNSKVSVHDGNSHHHEQKMDVFHPPVTCQTPRRLSTSPVTYSVHKASNSTSSDSDMKIIIKSSRLNAVNLASKASPYSFLDEIVRSVSENDHEFIIHSSPSMGNGKDGFTQSNLIYTSPDAMVQSSVSFVPKEINTINSSRLFVRPSVQAIANDESLVKDDSIMTNSTDTSQPPTTATVAKENHGFEEGLLTPSSGSLLLEYNSSLSLPFTLSATGETLYPPTPKTILTVPSLSSHHVSGSLTTLAKQPHCTTLSTESHSVYSNFNCHSSSQRQEAPKGAVVQRNSVPGYECPYPATSLGTSSSAAPEHRELRHYLAAEKHPSSYLETRLVEARNLESLPTTHNRFAFAGGDDKPLETSRNSAFPEKNTEGLKTSAPPKHDSASFKISSILSDNAVWDSSKCVHGGTINVLDSNLKPASEISVPSSTDSVTGGARSTQFQSPSLLNANDAQSPIPLLQVPLPHLSKTLQTLEKTPTFQSQLSLGGVESDRVDLKADAPSTSKSRSFSVDSIFLCPDERCSTRPSLSSCVAPTFDRPSTVFETGKETFLDNQKSLIQDRRFETAPVAGDFGVEPSHEDAATNFVSGVEEADPLALLIGDQCSRTTPHALKIYADNKHNTHKLSQAQRRVQSLLQEVNYEYSKEFVRSSKESLLNGSDRDHAAEHPLLARSGFVNENSENKIEIDVVCTVDSGSHSLIQSNLLEGAKGLCSTAGTKRTNYESIVSHKESSPRRFYSREKAELHQEPPSVIQENLPDSQIYPLPKISPLEVSTNPNKGSSYVSSKSSPKSPTKPHSGMNVCDANNDALKHYFSAIGLDPAGLSALLESSGCSSHDQLLRLLLAGSGPATVGWESALSYHQASQNYGSLPSQVSSALTAQPTLIPTSSPLSGGYTTGHAPLTPVSPLTSIAPSCVTAPSSSPKGNSCKKKERESLHEKVSYPKYYSDLLQSYDKVEIPSGSPLEHLQLASEQDRIYLQEQQHLLQLQFLQQQQQFLNKTPTHRSSNTLQGLSRSPSVLLSPPSPQPSLPSLSSVTKVEHSPNVSTTVNRDSPLSYHQDGAASKAQQQEKQLQQKHKLQKKTQDYSPGHFAGSKGRDDLQQHPKKYPEELSQQKLSKNFNHNQKRTESPNSSHKDKKGHQEKAKDSQSRSSSASAASQKNRDHYDYQQHLQVQQLYQQLELLQRLQKPQVGRTNQSVESPSPRCEINYHRSSSSGNTPANDILVTTTMASHHHHQQHQQQQQQLQQQHQINLQQEQHHQAYLQWATSQLAMPPLSLAAATSVTPSISSSGHGGMISSAGQMAGLTKKEMGGGVGSSEGRVLKKERHPSSPASIVSAVLSPPASSCSTAAPRTSSSTSATLPPCTSVNTHHSLSSPLTHWPLPPTPCTPTMPVAPTLTHPHTPYWLPQLSHGPQLTHSTAPTHQFAAGLGSVEPSAGSGASPGAGIGYQFMTDPITRQLILVHHAAIQDVSSNLMWGYGGVTPLLPQQMLLTDPHFARTLHPALLHTPTLHPTLHPTPPTLHQASSTYHQVTPCSLNLQASGGVKAEPPKNSPKAVEDDPKLRVFISPTASANIALPTSALSTNLQTALPSGLSSSLASSMQSALPSALPPGLTPSLASAMQPSLPQSLTPTLPHYLYPPSSLPLFCPKPPLFNISAFVQTPTSPIISVITTTTTTTPASTNTNTNTNMAVAALMMSPAKEIEPARDTVHDTISISTPPMAVLSPQLPKSPFSKPESSRSSSATSVRTATPTLVQQPKHSPLFVSQSSPSPQSSLPKIKVRNLQKNSHDKIPSCLATLKTKTEEITASPRLPIKKEIKQEFLPHLASLEREEAKCVDLSMTSSQKVKTRDTKSIKQESGVPDSAKNVLNQRSLALSSNLSHSIVDNQSVHLSCLNSSHKSEVSARLSRSDSFDSRVSAAASTMTSSAACRHPNVQSSSNCHSNSIIDSYSLPKQSQSVSSKEAVCQSVGSVVPAFPPVQEQALDLSGLELLSQSVLQHANRLSSEPLVPAVEEVSSFVSVKGTMQKKTCVAISARSDHLAISTLTTGQPVSAEVALLPSVPVCDQVGDGPLNCSPNGNTVAQARRTSLSAQTPTLTNISSPPPSSVQPSNYLNNFSLLCALAEQELLVGEQKDETKCNSSSKPSDSNVAIDVIDHANDFSKYPDIDPSVNQEVSCNHDSSAKSSTMATTPDKTMEGSVSHLTTSAHVASKVESVTRRDSVDKPEAIVAHPSQTTSSLIVVSLSDSYNSDWTSKSNSFMVNSPMSTCSSNSSPLDLSLSLSKKSSSPTPGPSSLTLPTTSVGPTQQCPTNTGTVVPSIIRPVEFSRMYETSTTKEPLLSDYDTSSSDNQNFEGFEDTSCMGRTELNMRRQLAVLERQYREKVRILHRQYPPQDVSSSKRKPGRPQKRKRCHSESSKRKMARPRKQTRLDEHKELSPPYLEREMQRSASYQQGSSDEEENLKQVPILTISGLKPQMMGGELMMSPRLESRVPVSQSSSENECSTDEEEPTKSKKPHRRWSLSFISSERNSSSSSRPSKVVHRLSPRVERLGSEDERTHGNVSDSSGRDSKALNTETSAVESSPSDHETPFASRSSSKKRKPGRPKKHSPTKKDTTETIVAKKHKNLNFIMHHPGVMTSKSKVKPKLKAETREIQLDEGASYESESQDEQDTKFMTSSQARHDHLLQTQLPAPSYQCGSPLPECVTSYGGNTKLGAIITSTPVASPTITSSSSSASSVASCATGSSSSLVSTVASVLSGTVTTSSCSAVKRRRGAGSSSLTRRAIMRDKEKRKTDAEQQCQMKALFRTLKKRSTIANAEHDESEDEGEYDSDQSMERVPSGRLGIDECSKSVFQDVVIKKESGLEETEPPKATGEEGAQLHAVIKTEPSTEASITGTDSSQSHDAVPVSLSAATSLPSSLGSSSTHPSGPASVCSLAVNELVKGCRVLFLRDDGLLYAGSVNPITPPDLYEVIIDGERGNKGHIYCAEEMLTQAWKEVKPGSTRFLKEGTRVCCFWSQQYRALYSGTVGSANSSPAHSDASSQHNFVNVEFDDGDSGRIHVDDIRLLPQDYPVTVPKPNPLLTLCTRKRRQPTRDSLDSKPPSLTVAGLPSSNAATSSPSSATAVKMTVTTSAGTCKVTSSTTMSSGTVNIADSGTGSSSKKNKLKKKKKISSRKEQKRLSKEWDNASAKESDDEGNASRPKKMRKGSTDSQNEEQNSAATNRLVDASPRVHSVETMDTGDQFRHDAGNNSNSENKTGTEMNNSFESREKKDKKKKKKHSRSEDHHHKRRKHKHKKNKTRHEGSDNTGDTIENVNQIQTTDQSQTISVNHQGNDQLLNQQQLFPHVEKVDGDLRVRIKSPPPNKITSENFTKSSNSQLSHNENLNSDLRSWTVCDISSNTCGSAEGTSSLSSPKPSLPSVVGRPKREVSSHGSLRIKEFKEKSKTKARSSRPKRSSSRAESVTYDERTDDDDEDNNDSSADDELSDEAEASGEELSIATSKKNKSTSKKSQQPSGKSKIAAFLPEKELWQWSGNGSKKTTGKGRGRKIFYKEIVRGDESIRVGDCCVFRSSGPPDNPYIGRIEHLCEGWGGNRSVTVHWFYHPNEINDEPKKLKQPKGALFESNHRDTNDLQTISYKCQVLTLSEYRARLNYIILSKKNNNNNTTSGPNTAADDCDISKQSLESNEGHDLSVHSKLPLHVSGHHSQTDQAAGERLFAEPHSLVSAACVTDSPMQPVAADSVGDSLDDDTMTYKEPASKLTNEVTANKNGNSTHPLSDAQPALTETCSGRLASPNPQPETRDVISNPQQEPTQVQSILSEASSCVTSPLNIPPAPTCLTSPDVDNDDTDKTSHSLGSSITNSSSSNLSSCSDDASNDSEDDKEALNECYYLAGTYDVIHQILRMEPGVE